MTPAREKCCAPEGWSCGKAPPPTLPRSADPTSPQPPCRGRRPRRPAAAVSADLTTFRPPPRRGGVPPPPGVRSRPALRRCAEAAELRAAGAARKGGTPGEGSPFNPLLRFVSKREFRALRRASKGSAPGPRPLFCKKAGQKTFKRQSTSDPNPSPLGRVMTISPRSGHLSGRVAAPTRVGEAGGSRNLTGAPPPHKRFSLGLHPVSLGKTKEMGWNWQHNLKIFRKHIGEFLNPAPTKGCARAFRAPQLHSANSFFSATRSILSLALCGSFSIVTRRCGSI